MLSDIGAADVPELIVINKADRATAETLTVLRTSYPDAVVVSARTGEGMDELRTAIEGRLPRPEREVRALIPYDRGDLINRIHQAGEFVEQEHTENGTLVVARVHPELAGELSPYELAGRAERRPADGCARTRSCGDAPAAMRPADAVRGRPGGRGRAGRRPRSAGPDRDGRGGRGRRSSG